MEQVIKDIAGRITDQAQKLGTGRIDYEVVEALCSTCNFNNFNKN